MNPIPGLPPITEYAGKLYRVYDTQQIAAKFIKRVFILEMKPRHAKHPEFIRFELKQERCAHIDPFKKGDPLIVAFVVRGRRVLNQGGQEETFYTSNEVVDLKPDLFPEPG